jgi:hypothetical protein
MAVEFLSDTKPDYEGACWSYRCTGLHEGSPITCYVYDPRLEADEGYASVQYSKIEWDIPTDVTCQSFHKDVEPDDHDPEDCASDHYWDTEIRDDLREALMH